jgi:hypothetical protein
VFVLQIAGQYEYFLTVKTIQLGMTRASRETLQRHAFPCVGIPV